MSKKIYQYSSINALMAGVFEGAFHVKDVKEKGNFGLGCSDGLKGELIIDNHDFFEARGNQDLKKLNDLDLLPFAQITTFNPEDSSTIKELNKNNLYHKLKQKINLDNLFLAVKMEGFFDNVKIRKPNDTEKVFLTALDVAKEQLIQELNDIKGTMVAFWTPDFFQNISVSGFHLHFYDVEKKIGGHVIDFSISEAKVSYEVKSSIDISLPEKESFINKDLNIENMAEIIKKVEN